jgi:hypothetical protein
MRRRVTVLEQPGWSGRVSGSPQRAGRPMVFVEIVTEMPSGAVDIHECSPAWRRRQIGRPEWGSRCRACQAPWEGSTVVTGSQGARFSRDAKASQNQLQSTGLKVRKNVSDATLRGMLLKNPAGRFDALRPISSSVINSQTDSTKCLHSKPFCP